MWTANPAVVRAALILLCFAVPTAVIAQETDWATTPPDPDTPQGENMDVPEGWEWRLDHPTEDFELIAEGDPSKSEVLFVNMTPGWHIATGPALILYHPALTASGTYRARAVYHLFPPAERNEAFGIFVGGQNLDSEDQTYLYFLIRKSGEYLVKLRMGESTVIVEEWTEHSAIVPHTGESEGSVENSISVEVGEDSVEFFVNDEMVTSLLRGELPVEGHVGLRVNHALNVHVSDLGVEQL